MVNIQLKKATPDVVENQIRENNPSATKKTQDRLLKAGYSKDDAMKLIGRAVAVEIYKVLRNKEHFNDEKYVKPLRELQ